MATCALRPSVLCGPGDYQLVPAIHACIAKSETPFIIGLGDNLWDVTHVSNVADSHVLAVENLMTIRTAAGEAFFIQNNEPITFRDFCLAIWAHFGHTPPFEIRIPMWLAYFAGLVCEIVTWVTGTTTTLSRGSVRDACAIRYASGDKARTILGYEARIGMEDAIRLSCEVSRDNIVPGGFDSNRLKGKFSDLTRICRIMLAVSEYKFPSKSIKGIGHECLNIDLNLPRNQDWIPRQLNQIIKEAIDFRGAL